MNNNKVVIILGMHRSGTSLTAQWLSKCGLNIGDNLMGASDSNRDGHFEDLDFHDLHEEIFQAHDIPYGGLENIENISLSKEERRKIKSLVGKKNKKYHQWGWKEPRTCLFIDEYIRLIPHVKIIVVLRDFNAVINSLINRATKQLRGTILNSGRMGKLRLIIYDLTQGKELNKRLAKKYSKTTILYYKKIIEALNKKDKHDIVSIRFDKLFKADALVMEKLVEWQIYIVPVKIESLMKKNYVISKDRCKHIPPAERNILNKLQKQLYSIT